VLLSQIKHFNGATENEKRRQGQKCKWEKTRDWKRRDQITGLETSRLENAAPVKVKVKEVDLYSAIIVVPHTQGAQVRITVLPANYTVPASTS